MFHFEWIYIGTPVFLQHFYLWVEFFFVLSGFFLARNTEGKLQGNGIMNSVEYTFRQAKKMYPSYLIGFIFSFIVYCKVCQIEGCRNTLKLLWHSKWEIAYLQLSGIEQTAPTINGVTSYIPALLAASLILHYLLCNHRKFTTNIVSVLAPIAIYSHIMNTYGNLSQWIPYENWYTIGILRAIAGMSLGIFAYSTINCKTGGGKESIILTIISLILMVGLVVCRNDISYYDEVMYPYVFAVCIGSIYVRTPKYSIVSLENIIIYLGKISLNIYVIHYGICYLMKTYFPEKKYGSMAIVYVVSVCVLAIMVEFIITEFRKLLSRTLQ